MSEEETEEYVSAVNALVEYRLNSTELILRTDFYEQAFGSAGRVTGRLSDVVRQQPSEPET